MSYEDAREDMAYRYHSAVDDEEPEEDNDDEEAEQDESN